MKTGIPDCDWAVLLIVCTDIKLQKLFAEVQLIYIDHVSNWPGNRLGMIYLTT
jgi:hypothetical protein